MIILDDRRRREGFADNRAIEIVYGHRLNGRGAVGDRTGIRSGDGTRSNRIGLNRTARRRSDLDIDVAVTAGTAACGDRNSAAGQRNCAAADRGRHHAAWRNGGAKAIYAGIGDKAGAGDFQPGGQAVRKRDSGDRGSRVAVG